MEDPKENKNIELSDDELPEKKKYVKPVVEEQMELPQAAATIGLTPAGPSA